MAELRVGVLGASSLVGQMLLPRLLTAGYDVTAYTRASPIAPGGAVRWRQLGMEGGAGALPLWVCVAPIWVLPDYFDWLVRLEARRIVALSSTSRYTKDASSDPQEQETALRLAKAEARLQDWAQQHDVRWTILRPTLIYGQGHDKNVAEMARFIRRFGFFPVFGPAQGLRQPIHADDVAAACVAALSSAAAADHAYNLAGGETLSYRQMAGRVFMALGRPVRLLGVPLWCFRLTLAVLRRVPRFSHWTAAMAERMNQDLVFDSSAAVRDLAFKPRAFVLQASDVGGTR